MTILIGLLLFALLIIVLIQVSRITEITRALRGEEDWKWVNSKRIGIWLLVFGVVFILLTVGSAYYYKNYMMGYGPHSSASEHGHAIDSLWNLTVFFTGIVFVVTQFLLFYFAWKYRQKKSRKAEFIHDNMKLEMIWTVIPSVVLVILLLKGLIAWNDIMADVKDDDEFLEIETMGMQFNWILRYPGEDGKIGARDFRLTSASNPLGQDWTDPKNLDDLQPSDIVLPVGKKVRFRILSRDVLHSFFLPHFRVKMDAVPGMPTYFVFTPSTTTEEYRKQLSEYPEYQVPADPDDPEGPQKWEVFDYELACAELCGNGHFSMRKVVRVVEQEEYEAWLKEQTPYYFGSIRGKDSDPYKDQLFDSEIEERTKNFENDMYEAMYKELEEGEKRVYQLDNVQFQSGSSELTELSTYELQNLADFMEENDELRIEIQGHTDNTGDEADNITLSQNRADRVAEFLRNAGVSPDRFSSKGYGSSMPVESNDTAEDRAMNRRVQIEIL